LDESGIPYRLVAAPVAADATGRTLVLVRHDATASPLPPVPGSDVTFRVANGTGTATVIGLSVESPGSTSAADDRIERFTAVNIAALALDGPVVVAGNLEASRWSHAFKLLAEGMTNSENGFGYAATWPSYDWPLVGSYTGLPVDHAIYIGSITVPYRRVGPDLGPAHRPLLFDISPTG
jgi:endonuclease/exonuclease/phosphatase (EEP) superfamily protein YafD